MPGLLMKFETIVCGCFSRSFVIPNVISHISNRALNPLQMVREAVPWIPIDLSLIECPILCKAFWQFSHSSLILYTDRNRIFSVCFCLNITLMPTFYPHLKWSHLNVHRKSTIQTCTPTAAMRREENLKKTKWL